MSLSGIHFLSGAATNSFVAAPLARRDVNVFEQMQKLSNGLMQATRDLPKCFTISARDVAKEPKCTKVYEANLKTEKMCSSLTFEDEQLGQLKCACKIQREAGDSSYKDAKPCIEAFCSGGDVDKVQKVLKDLTQMALNQCDLLPEYAKLMRDGFTATMDGQVVTIPPAAAGYPTTAFDFITETTKASKPTSTSADSDEEEEEPLFSGAAPALPTKGASTNGTASDDKDEDAEDAVPGSGAGAFSVKSALTFVVALMPVMAAVLL